ncbi:MAG: hypothetical protein ACI30W_08110, partial [Muribaculaceae bacterium]
KVDDGTDGDLEQEIAPAIGPFGEIYTQFKGKPQEAITYLLAKKGGEAVGALYHKEIGSIDLVWGKEGTGHSDGFGLAKLAKFHPEVLFNLQDILNDMVVTGRSENRVQLESEKYQAAVRLTWDNKKKTWLLTMFEKKNSVLDNTTDTGKTLMGNGNDTATPENTVSDGKGNNSASEKQENGAKSAENEAQEADGDVDMPDKQGQGASLQWSEKKAANGEPFLIGENGSIDLVKIPGEVFAAMGIAPAPFRLTPSMVAHVYERHKKELKLKSPEDAVAVVLDVMNNFDHVRRGKDTTFVFSIEDGRNKTAKRAVTIVLQYEDGKWIGIKTVGLDRVKSLNELATLWGKGESPSSTAGVATANVTSAQPSEGDRVGGIASNQNAANTNGKGSEKSADAQDGGGEKGVGTKLEDFGEKIAGARKDALRELSATIEAANVQSFVALPLSKAFRRPSIKKLVEAGVVDENEAKVIEAMSLVILGHRKPVLTKRLSSNRDVEKWAQEQYKAAQVIKAFVEGDKEARTAIIEQLKAEYERGKESGEEISPAAFAYAVLERAGLGDMSGYKPVDMWVRKYGKSYA